MTRILGTIIGLMCILSGVIGIIHNDYGEAAQFFFLAFILLKSEYK